MEKKSKKYYFRLDMFKTWPGMMCGLEFWPAKCKQGFEVRGCLCIMFIVIIDFEYCWFKNGRN